MTERADHTFELPYAVPVMQCSCRRAWLRMKDGERALDQFGAIQHVGPAGYFRCCQRRWKWTPPVERPAERTDADGDAGTVA